MLAYSVDACIAFAGGVFATRYGWRPAPAGPKHLEWIASKESWSRTSRIAGIFLIATSIIDILAKAA
jgi:hypothetical protein